MSILKPWWLPQIKRPQIKARNVILSTTALAVAEGGMFFGADSTREWAGWHVDGATSVGKGAVWFVAEPVEAVFPCLFPVAIIDSAVHGDLSYNKDCVGDFVDRAVDKVKGRSGGDDTPSTSTVSSQAVLNFAAMFEEAGFPCSDAFDTQVVVDDTPTSLMLDAGTSQDVIDEMYDEAAFIGAGLVVDSFVTVADCGFPPLTTIAG